MDFLMKQEAIYKKAIQSKMTVSEMDTNTDMTSDTIVDTNNNDTVTEIMDESEDELLPIEKETIDIKCNGETFSYCIGEVLNKELHSLFLSAFKNGDEKYSTPLTYTIHLCIYKINVKGCIPFLEFLLNENIEKKSGNEQKILQFPQTKVTLSQEAMDNHDLIPDELLMGLSDKGIELGLFPENMIPTTEELNKYFNGFIEGEPHDTISTWNWLLGRTIPVKDIFFFFPIPEENWNSKTESQWAILDEIINKKKMNNIPINPYISYIFYNYPDLMTIYGSDTNFLIKEKESVMKTLESAHIQTVSNSIESSEYRENMILGGKKLKEWNTKGYVSKCSKTKVPQEIPFCLYLCNDKLELNEENENEEEDGNETNDKKDEKVVEKKDEKEMKQILSSPKELFKTVSVSGEENENKKEKESILLRTNYTYGYYYYFTDEPINTNELPKRFAVFVYNTQYVLDENTTQIVKELQLEEYFEKKDNKNKKLKTKTETETETETKTETENENENEKMYDSIYFQQDEIPLWCIKHNECIVEL